ncbi:hypothetical protein, partial [Glaesserella parasuis]|uniref:hypothetical protein n=1 Tax=Glaesserella parasuis TaxID=738 RepID=UPI003F348A82
MNELENAVTLDFETASKCDLGAAGLGRYLADPTTRPTCLTFRLQEFGKPFPMQIGQAIERGAHFWAHNAPFDYHIWNEVLRAFVPDLPRVRIEQVRCSAARARYNGLPGSLAGACDALGLPIRKVVIPVAAGRNIAVLREAAVRNTILQLRGIDTLKEFIERQRR